MTVKDFFTLTEMKDGHTSTARVSELANVMQMEKDCIAKNVGDAIWKWSIVASTIPATNEKILPYLVIKLDDSCLLIGGLRMLQIPVRTQVNFLEESILLHKIRRIFVLIWMTVNNLLGHCSDKVKDRARVLFDRWKPDGDSDVVPQDVDKAGVRVISPSGGFPKASLDGDMDYTGPRICCSQTKALKYAGLEYGVIDALEVARQVTIEVERDFGDRRESSESNSPESIHESFQVTEAAQEPEVNTEKGVGDFDLNQEGCSEEMDRPTNAITNHIFVVSASRAAAAPRLPLAPLQFEGARGWKGPSATSAFRPVSPRRFVESDSTHIGGGTHSSPKQRRQDFLGFDLNKTDSADDEIANLIPGKQILVSGESSVEVGPRRSEGLKLDLNRISEDDDAPPDWSIEGRICDHKNGHLSPPPSSSTSSMLRNIDLNDQPSLCNDSSNLQPYFGKSSSLLNLNGSEGTKSGDSVIYIMGTRVKVNQNDFDPRSPSLPNGRILGPSLDDNLAKRGGFSAMESPMPYAPPPVFGYSPCVVDSKGAPVVPQTWDSASTYQPPFVTHKMGTHPGSMEAGPSRLPNVDLNPGFIIERGNRESSEGVLQIFNSGEVWLNGEPLRVNSQPSSDSGGTGKRKEPEGGSEPYPFGYRHQPQWK
ncbi:hypothetical protein RHSIM_RhsimUnG0065300 [Rhododendron simsii]|uniref:Uncharacterized protein n=1 Tax=Rhododendron simsii TaxID=118357 RepID=A0A834G285_RHOSS|nr:hypothetical protein RHSIM_RhsimUnG0065300 [Rhododendron simsii]